MHADKHQSFYKLTLLFLMEVVRLVQSIQNRNLVKFLQYLGLKLNITIAKFDLFFHHHDDKEITFYYFRDTKHKTKYVNSIYIVGFMFVR